ncbi:MAG: hypothetical protein MK211_03940 [Flavobacteriales bacterium]|jgi:hypothetical protein|nr:hypothetical protein [Flavobacteriales bacterium]
MGIQDYQLQEFCNQLRIAKNLNAKRGLATIHKLLSLVDLVKIEINKNASILNDRQLRSYTDFVKGKILHQRFTMEVNDKIILYYLNLYETTKEQLEQNKITNRSLKALLSFYINPYLGDEKTKRATEFQEIFVRYYVSVSAVRILDFCETLIGSKNSEDSTKAIKTNSTSIPNEIKNSDAFKWFNDVLYERNALNEDSTPKRKFQAVAHAIFKNPKCKEHIFKSSLQLDEYIDFLNRQYSAEINTTKSLSDPTKHIDYVDELITRYLKTTS